MCLPLDAIARHLFTSRSWTLGSTRDDVAWNEIAHAMAVQPPALVRLRQVHGAAVVVCRAEVHAALGDRGAAGAPAPPEADIVITNDRESAVAVQTADCVPLLIADARQAVVAAAHAGWRGLAARVPAVAVDALAREFDSRPADMIAAIGPSIGACCYEVGEEVRARFEAAEFPADALARWFLAEPRPTPQNPSFRRFDETDQRPDRWFFDSWAATREQLETSGVPAARIHAAELCTASHPGEFCSYRRDGPGAGRMAAAIRCAPPRP